MQKKFSKAAKKVRHPGKVRVVSAFFDGFLPVYVTSRCWQHGLRCHRNTLWQHR
jgi:hypothetical protein